MKLLRRVLVVFAVVIGCVAAALVAAAVLLPSDATSNILALRGRYGGGEQLAAARDARSSIREIALRNDRGEVLTTAWVRRPLALRPDYRVVVTYAGANTGEAILPLIPESDDLVVVAVQYPWTPPHTIMGKLRAIYDMRQAAYRTIAGGLLAVDYLSRDEHLDTRRIVLLGASLGSIFATIHGAIDRRVPQVVLIHGGAALADTLDAEGRGVPEWLRGPLARIVCIPIETFDPARYVARISPRRLLIIGGRDDWRFPPNAVVAFFNRARQPKELRWTKTGHVGARNRPVAEAVLSEVRTYLESR